MTKCGVSLCIVLCVSTVLATACLVIINLCNIMCIHSVSNSLPVYHYVCVSTVSVTPCLCIIMYMCIHSVSNSLPVYHHVYVYPQCQQQPAWYSGRYPSCLPCRPPCRVSGLALGSPSRRSWPLQLTKRNTVSSGHWSPVVQWSMVSLR